MIVGIAVIFGLLIGSFLNVVIYRVPNHQSIVWPASHCPACKAAIAPRDNIPIVSYILLRGRCRNCGTHISTRYPAVEALTGILFGIAAYEFGLSLRIVSALVLIAVLIVLSGTDLDHRLLPNVIVGPAALIGFILSVIESPSWWWIYLVSAVGVAGFLFVLALVYPGGMGMGDVKMGGMLGTFLGPYAALAVFLGALCGALIGGLLMAAGRIRRRSALPFGVFMAVGGIVALFVGPGLWQAYLRLIGGA